MAKNPNTKTIYIRDNNLDRWESLNNKKGDFINWSLEHKLKDYQKHLDKYNKPKSKE
jgi:hypothetical protein